jgi:transcriptional regulator with XRE-family HTH domain
MQIGQRLRELRKAKDFTQGDIQERTRLLRSYTSRVEHGQTVPSITTLEKYARALEVPLYRLFYAGEEPPEKPKLLPAESMDPMGDASGEEWPEFRRVVKALSRMNDRERALLLGLTQQMARRKREDPSTSS